MNIIPPNGHGPTTGTDMLITALISKYVNGFFREKYGSDYEGYWLDLDRTTGDFFFVRRQPYEELHRWPKASLNSSCPKVIKHDVDKIMKIIHGSVYKAG